MFKKILRKLKYRFYLGQSLYHKIKIERIGIYQFSIVNSKFFNLKGDFLNFNFDKHFYVLKGANYYNALKYYTDACFTFQEEQLVVVIKGLKYEVQTFEELFILNEIFIYHSYQISLNKPYIIMEIGGNVGYTSLFLANNSNCNAVYSYEPFPQTYKQALKNIDLNPELRQKIKPLNYGIGEVNKKLKLPYHPSYKGVMGINTDEKALKSRFGEDVVNQIEYEEIEIIEVNEAIEFISKTHPNDYLVIKMDCEGCEYEIFENIEKTLKHVKALMIEWHYKGPDTLIEKLNNCGFVSFSLYNSGGNDGMIYAVNTEI